MVRFDLPGHASRSGRRAGLETEIEHQRDGAPGGCLIEGWIPGDVASARNPLIQVEAELVSSGLKASVFEVYGCAGCVSTNTSRPSLPDFHTRRGQLDQPLENTRNRPSSAVCMPEGFPGLVGLPVIARVEQLNTPKEHWR